MARNDQRSVPVALFAIAALLLALRIAWSLTDDPPKSRVGWVSIEQGMESARATGMPILFDFTAEWCGPCHVLDKEVFADPELAGEINRRFIAIRVTDRQQEDGRNTPLVAELQRRYGVNGFPTLVFANPSGAELGRMEGYGGRKEFQRVMEQVR
jgi:uncharacterized protein YyaL (SSP411 family)